MTDTKVWIDQDLCTGDGICEEICPSVFRVRDDGLWVVIETDEYFDKNIVFDGQKIEGMCECDAMASGEPHEHAPEGSRGVARIPDELLDLAIEAAEECPGECIMIEPVL